MATAKELFDAHDEPSAAELFAAHGEPAPTAEAQPMGGPEALLRGSTEAIPFGQQAVAAGIAGTSKVMQILAHHGLIPRAYENMDSSLANQLTRERAAQEKAKKDSPKLNLAGRVLGGGLSAAALSPFKATQGADLLTRTAAAGANMGVYGAAHGAGNADDVSEMLPKATEEAVPAAASGIVGHLALGELLPAVVSPESIKNLAGKVKFLSMKPLTGARDAAARLPGGAPAVGREAMDAGVGGMTKEAVAEAAKAAKREAADTIDSVVGAHVAGGKSPVDLRQAISNAQTEALKLMDEPTTETAGEKLATLVDKYQARYGQDPVPADRALKLKRVLYRASRGAGKQASKSGDPVMGDYKAGIDGLAHDVDASMDATVGPEFQQANDQFRRLNLVSEVAKKTANRAASLKSHALPLLLGASELAAGHGSGKAAATAAGMELLGRYGPPIGARMLYGTGKVLDNPAVTAIPKNLIQSAILQQLLGDQNAQ